MELKPTIFVGGAKRAIKRFPEDARKEAGWQLQRVQAGKDPADWKSMSSVGSGVKEIRIHHPHEHRVIYIAQFEEAVYVLHAFEKKTQRTPQNDLATARAAYAEIIERRKKQKK